jgi:hypothetical protein
VFGIIISIYVDYFVLIEGGADRPIPLPNVKGSILKAVS